MGAADLDPASRERLKHEANVWIATVRSDGRPHIVPVWFVFVNQRFYLCIQPASVKARNLRRDDRVSLSLEDGSRPLTCEGRACFLTAPWPVKVAQAFRRKYDWDLSGETEYTAMIEVTPERWLIWGSQGDRATSGD